MRPNLVPKSEYRMFGLRNIIGAEEVASHSSIPRGIVEQVKRAITHHVTSNRHHPEFYADPNDMSDVDLIEMVCDWTAMAQEFGQDGGSARGWADKTIGKRVAFIADKRRLIYRMIEELDQQIAANP